MSAKHKRKCAVCYKPQVVLSGGNRGELFARSNQLHVWAAMDVLLPGRPTIETQRMLRHGTRVVNTAKGAKIFIDGGRTVPRGQNDPNLIRYRDWEVTRRYVRACQSEHVVSDKTMPFRHEMAAGPRGFRDVVRMRTTGKMPEEVATMEVLNDLLRSTPVHDDDVLRLPEAFVHVNGCVDLPPLNLEAVGQLVLDMVNGYVELQTPETPEENVHRGISPAIMDGEILRVGIAHTGEENGENGDRLAIVIRDGDMEFTHSFPGVMQPVVAVGQEVSAGDTLAKFPHHFFSISDVMHLGEDVYHELVLIAVENASRILAHEKYVPFRYVARREVSAENLKVAYRLTPDVVPLDMDRAELARLERGEGIDDLRIVQAVRYANTPASLKVDLGHLCFDLENNFYIEKLRERETTATSRAARSAATTRKIVRQQAEDRKAKARASSPAVEETSIPVEGDEASVSAEVAVTA